MKVNLEQDVRVAAVALKDAIAAAEAAGYVVTWPGRASDLAGIAISETGQVAETAAKAAAEAEYDSMLKSDLVDLAVSRGIAVDDSWLKADLVAALKG